MKLLASISSNKPSIVSTELNQEYSVEEDLNAVAASLIVNIGRESMNTFLHQVWVHRRISLAQTAFVGATQNRKFSFTNRINVQLETPNTRIFKIVPFRDKQTTSNKCL